MHTRYLERILHRDRGNFYMGPNGKERIKNLPNYPSFNMRNGNYSLVHPIKLIPLECDFIK